MIDGLGRAKMVQQVVEYLLSQIETGAVAPGEAIPPSRKLALDMGVSRGTVITAIEFLQAEGTLISRLGAGVYVADCARKNETDNSPFEGDLIVQDKVIKPKVDCKQPNLIDFRPCRPSMELFPSLMWRKLVSQNALVGLSHDYDDARGVEPLRIAISQFLRRVRGLKVLPEHVMVTNGSLHAMGLILQHFYSKKAVFFHENPGYPLVRQSAELNGWKLEPIPVDAEGIMPDRLPLDAPKGSILHITPSHQFPTGGTLSLERRYALIDWAEKVGAFIIEDDYDGEFRYDQLPVRPLASLGSQRVFYCGTFSKTLSPSLRTGFVVAPSVVIEALKARRTIAEYHQQVTIQHALAQFISMGHFERYLFRMTRFYKKRRNILIGMLSDIGLGNQIGGSQTGLNIPLYLLDQKTENHMIDFSKKHKILFSGFDGYRGQEDISGAYGLCIGFSCRSEQELTLAAEVVHKGLKRQ